MSKVTEGVKQFFSSSDKPQSTEVCTEVAPEVTQEHVRPQEHTEAIEAVDRERHVHHHQHRVQPVEDHRTLDTQHVHTTAPIIERERKADMAPEHQAKLHEMRTQHQDQTNVGEVERSGTHLGVATQEHEHHHIHETIQPVIQRETIQPTTVHHTIGVHEKIHDAPIVHESTTLPTLSHADFLKQKAADVPHTHSDSNHKHAIFEGKPRVGGSADQTTA